MKAMILAAGRGERMRPLTDTTPKPLLEAGGKPLIVYHVERLRDAGFSQIVINIDYLGHQIIDALGDGAHWGIDIVYSDEREEGALESLGGIVKALPLMGDAPFLIVNGDVWCDFPFDATFALKRRAHLVLVPNPDHNPRGDFCLDGDRLCAEGSPRWTFAGIGYYTPALFDGVAYGRAPLAPLLRERMREAQISGEIHRGQWRDIGTPQRLAELDAGLK